MTPKQKMVKTMSPIPIQYTQLGMFEEVSIDDFESFFFMGNDI